MTEYTISRREFLRSTTRIGVSLTLTTALCRPAIPAMADDGSVVSILGGLDILRMPDVQGLLTTGLGALWVAGTNVNNFASNLAFENLPIELKLKLLKAGGDWKSLPAARAIWETIPAPVRASGPEATLKFLKGKDWSHIIPRSWGGPTTAENGIWWSAEKNKSLGPNPMGPDDITDAKTALRNAAIRSTIVQTVNGMLKGALVGVVAGGLLACLEYGLQYAEGEITWPQMVRKVIASTIIAGAGAFIAAGLIVGISLMFPFLIPIFLPVIFAIQVAGMVFLGRQLVPLAIGWWNVLNGQQLLDAASSVLKAAGSELRNVYEEAEGNVLDVVWGWVVAMADRVGLDTAWKSAIRIIRTLGVDQAWVWFAEQTQTVVGKAAGVASTLSSWDYESDLDEDVDSLRESIATVISSEFQNAISATDELLRSIGDYRKNANHKAAEPLLVA